MITYLPIISFLIALGVTAICTPIVRMIAARRGWVDAPDGARKLHSSPTPTLGGLAIFAGLAAALLYLYNSPDVAAGVVTVPTSAIWFGAIIILIAGMFDDTKGIGFKGKFAVQLAVAYMLLHAGLRLDLSALPFLSEDVYSQALFSVPLTLLWIVGVINAVNLLDGLDGLAAGIGLIAFTALSLIFLLHGQLGLAIISLLVAGSLVGFLFYNFNPASIFMGDSGSLLLGYLLATLTLQGWGHVEPGVAFLVPIVILGLPLLDTLVAIVRRLRSRRAIFAPDRDHIHHRLARRLPHRNAVLTLYAAGAGFAIAAVLISLIPPMQAGGIVLITSVVSLAGIWHLGYHRTSQILDDAAPLATREEPALQHEIPAPGGDGVAASDAGPGLDHPEPVVRISRVETAEGRKPVHGKVEAAGA